MVVAVAAAWVLVGAVAARRLARAVRARLDTVDDHHRALRALHSASDRSRDFGRV